MKRAGLRGRRLGCSELRGPKGGRTRLLDHRRDGPVVKNTFRPRQTAARWRKQVGEDFRSSRNGGWGARTRVCGSGGGNAIAAPPLDGGRSIVKSTCTIHLAARSLKCAARLEEAVEPPRAGLCRVRPPQRQEKRRTAASKIVSVFELVPPALTTGPPRSIARRSPLPFPGVSRVNIKHPQPLFPPLSRACAFLST